MKKFLAVSGLASSVAFWAMTSMIPKLVAIALVLFMSDAIVANNYTFNSTGIGQTIVTFVLDFLKAGGVKVGEVVIGV